MSEADASLTASLFAVDPHGLGGVCLRSPAHPPRDQWLGLLRYLLPAAAGMRRIPFNISDSRLLGGLDLTATLRANRPVAERGAAAIAHGGVLIVSMAERLTAHTAANLNNVLDRGQVSVARDGVSMSEPAEFGIVALDEGMSEEEFTPRSLMERLALLLDLSVFNMRTVLTPLHDPDEILAARELLPRVRAQESLIVALSATAQSLGAGSARVTGFALHVARILAALEGRTEVNEDDAVIAGKFVLAPRATLAPAEAPREPPTEPPAEPSQQPSEEAPPDPPREAPGEAPGEPPPQGDPPQDSNPTQPSGPPSDAPPVDSVPPPRQALSEQDLKDVVLEATRAAIPAGLLARLRSDAMAGRGIRGGAGRVGAIRKGGLRGRPAGVRSGLPGTGRLNLIETLRAAAPWQRLRGRIEGDQRVRVSPDDFRITRYQQRAQTLTIFAVDASGSAALNRLAEAKGAVELLLADCYIRRDEVAVIAFRGQGADLLLPPTRSLVRAKRALAALPGGGGTPLAAALDAARLLAEQARRRGDSTTMVLLTDGRANVARGGTPGREIGYADALRAAAAFRAANITTLFIDTSTRANPAAQELARRMAARYIPLPYADARSLSKIVGAAGGRGR